MVAEGAAAADLPGAPSGFSLFGGSNPLLSAFGGGGGGAGSEPGLASLGAEPAASTDSAVLAFSSSGSLFGPSIFAPAGPPPPHSPADPSSRLHMPHPLAMHPPLSPSQLSGHGGVGSIPHSPLLLSPQQPGLAAPPSPAVPSATLPYLPSLASPVQHGSGLGSPLGDLSGVLGSPSQAPGLDFAGLAAFQQHLQHAGPPPFGNGAAPGALAFGGSSLLGGFGGLPAAQAGFGGGALDLGGGGGGGGMGGGGGALDDWSELQQQLPSDLGAMLGADPSLASPQRSPLKPAGAPQEGGEAGLYGGGAAAHWF